MSIRSALHIQEETISRFLSGKTADPGVSVVLDLGATVGLKPYEIFMDAQTSAEFQTFLELKSKSEETETERIRLIAENETLKSTNTALATELDTLRMKLNYLGELIASKDEIIALYRKLYKDTQ